MVKKTLKAIAGSERASLKGEKKIGTANQNEVIEIINLKYQYMIVI